MILLRRALGSSALQMRACFRFAEDDEGPVATGIEDNKKSELTRKFTGEVKSSPFVIQSRKSSIARRRLSTTDTCRLESAP